MAMRLPSTGTRRLRALPALLLLIASAFIGQQAFAAAGELTVVSMTPVQEAMTDALAKYQNETGMKVVLTVASRAQLKAKVHSAEHPDLVVASQEGMDMLEKEKLTEADTRATVGRAGMGVAMRQGATVPDLSNAEALKKALLNAKSLGYVDPQESPAGQQAVAVVQRLGITDTIKAKTQLGTGNNPVAPVGFGDVEIGIYPIHLIMISKGAQVAAPLPADLQQWTRYDAALIEDAPNANDAKRLLAFLRGAAAKASFAASGFEAAP